MFVIYETDTGYSSEDMRHVSRADAQEWIADFHAVERSLGYELTRFTVRYEHDGFECGAL